MFPDLRHETVYNGEETSFQITFGEQPKIDGDLLKRNCDNKSK